MDQSAAILFCASGFARCISNCARAGNLTVAVRGVDVYDPTTGQIRSHSTDDIACWFIDTNYNGESFFVRHAYFTGGDEPYEKLKRALRADIDEAAMVDALQHSEPPVCPARDRKDRGQSDQSLR